MKKLFLFLVFGTLVVLKPVSAQTIPDYSKIDILLVRGDYKKVIDTCLMILKTDSLNPDLHFKMGLAYQNLLQDDKSFECFLKASVINPGSSSYSFMVAKGYFSKGKTNLAKPLLHNLFLNDTLNWTYAYYLTSIYMQEKNYLEALNVYMQFYDRDSTDYALLDKIGFALLRMGFYPTAIKYYNKSLAINKQNVSSIKNLSFLYASTLRVDTALKLLTMGMTIDTTDMDLHIRRAALNFSMNYTKRALDDYLKILATGDSTVLYLKRSGIGYSNNLQPKEAIKYLRLALNKDSSDVETCNFLARNYTTLKDYKSSAFYYRHIIKTLNPFNVQTNMSYYLLAESLKNDGKYEEAISNYLLFQKFRSDLNIDLTIANIYDEKLKNFPKAIYHYELYLRNLKIIKPNASSDYTETIRKRLEYLKNPKPTN
jgi:tetratricopeptide (TPR) repeat protein